MYVILSTLLIDRPLTLLAHEVGWKYQDVVSKLEERRKVKSAAAYQIKTAKAKKVNDIKSSSEINSKLAKFGY